MDNSQKKLLEAYLQKADAKIASAHNLLEDSSYDDSTSRAYYAAFHSAQAVLLTEGLEADTHTGLRTLFSLHFIKTGKIENEYGKILKNLKDTREAGDYDAISCIDKESAETSLQEAEKFVARMKVYVENLIK